MAKKTKKRKISSLYIFPAIFFIICISYFARYLFMNIDTTILEYGTMESTVNTQALLVRNEWVAALPENVKAEYSANEGEKVAFGKKVLEIASDANTDENLAIKIKEINDRIAEMNQENLNNNFFAEDKEKIETNIYNLTQEIKRQAKAGNIANLTQARKDLTANLYKKSLIYGSGSFFGKNVEQLNQEKNMLETLYNKNTNVIYAQSAGIVSFELDGLEQVLNPVNIKNYKVNDIKNIINNISDKKNNKKEVKQSGVKIVDNLSWYICSIINANEASSLKEGKGIQIRFKQLSNALVDGKIISVSKPENGQSIVAIKIDENVKDFYKTRLTDIDLVKANYEGFTVPQKCIINKGGTDGIYILKKGTVKFVPVKVMLSDGKNALINNVDPADKVSSTEVLKVFDEVILSVHRVKDKQVILGKL